jgi:hypothetical protein
MAHNLGQPHTREIRRSRQSGLLINDRASELGDGAAHDVADRRGVGGVWRPGRSVHAVDTRTTSPGDGTQSEDADVV